MKTRNLHHRIKIAATPKQIYNLFINEKLHAELTRAEAKINNREGGGFHVYGTNNFGYSVKLIPNERIVQAWSHRDFPEGHFSIIDLQLKATLKGTRIDFYHYGVPAKLYKNFDKGWYDAYWKPMKRYFKRKKK